MYYVLILVLAAGLRALPGTVLLPSNLLIIVARVVKYVIKVFTLDGSSGSRIREMVCVLLLLVQCVVGVLARGEIPRPGGWRGQHRAPPAVAATASQRVVGVAGVVAQVVGVARVVGVAGMAA